MKDPFLSILAADALVVVHLCFILFVVLGGFLLFRFPRAAWLHLPAALWGAAVALNNWICPLTPLEQRLRLAAGEAGYSGGFVEHWILPLIYPAGLTREIQLGLGLFVVLINAALYGAWLMRRKRAKQDGPAA